jgi:hypothetical protein
MSKFFVDWSTLLFTLVYCLYYLLFPFLKKLLTLLKPWYYYIILGVTAIIHILVVAFSLNSTSDTFVFPIIYIFFGINYLIKYKPHWLGNKKITNLTLLGSLALLILLNIIFTATKQTSLLYTNIFYQFFFRKNSLFVVLFSISLVYSCLKITQTYTKEDKAFSPLISSCVTYWYLFYLIYPFADYIKFNIENNQYYTNVFLNILWFSIKGLIAFSLIFIVSALLYYIFIKPLSLLLDKGLKPVEDWYYKLQLKLDGELVTEDSKETI